MEDPFVARNENDLDSSLIVAGSFDFANIIFVIYFKLIYS